MKHINVSLFVPHLGCPHTCIFCNQKTISGTTEPITPQAITEACKTAAACPHDKNNSEIAFFGGSFTAIDRQTMLMCLNAAKPFLKNDFMGIRVSTRPDCINREILTLLKENGVTSIELGAQSMTQEVLTKNERGHTPQDTVNACRLIREYGFSLGLQMMTGLYGSTPETDINTARAFIELHPDTVRIYPTVVLEGTVLAQKYRAGEYSPQTLESAVEMCAQLLCMFKKANIKVIRLGLHSGGNVEDGFVAGVYHPAFRELCEAVIYRSLIDDGLKGKPVGEYNVYVCPSEVSKVTGQKKSNLLYFKNKGYTLKIKGDPLVLAYCCNISTV